MQDILPLKNITSWQDVCIREPDTVHKKIERMQRSSMSIIIFSANGLGTDPITSYLRSHHLMFSNIHTVSNAFTWSPDGRANGYRQPVIHSFNKSIAGIQKFPDIYAHIEQKRTILLLGDSLWDAHMAEWHDADTILRIWLLTKQWENLEQEKRAYSEVFDIVLVGDGDLTFVSSLLSSCKD